MGINVGKNYGAWKNVGGSFDDLRVQNGLVTKKKNKYSFSKRSRIYTDQYSGYLHGVRRYHV